MKATEMEMLRSFLLYLAAVFFIGAGANHFRSEAFYISITPPIFPNPRLLVQISGVCEILGGVGLLVPQCRIAAGWGLVALLIAVFPVHIYMVSYPERFHVSRVVLWIRLPLQAVLIYWVWFAGIRKTP